MLYWGDFFHSWSPRPKGSTVVDPHPVREVHFDLACQLVLFASGHLTPALQRHAEPGDLVGRSRRAIGFAQAMTHTAVVAELLAGASWDDVAEQLGMTPQGAAELYAPMVEAWMEGRRPLFPDLPDNVGVTALPSSAEGRHACREKVQSELRALLAELESSES